MPEFAVLVMIGVVVILGILMSFVTTSKPPRPAASVSGQQGRRQASFSYDKRARFNPGDDVVVKEDLGEYYADYPSQTILASTQGSTSIVVSFEAFRADFERRLTSGKHGDIKAYETYLAIVKEAVKQCQQCPVRWVKILPPADAVDLVRGQAGQIELVDTNKLEKAGGQPPEAYSVDKGALAKAAQLPSMHPGLHDEPKFTDLTLALVLSKGSPITASDCEIIYFHLTCLSISHALWYRLQAAVSEEALNIIDTLRFQKHNHPGYGWEEIEQLIEVNSSKKPLWYNLEQKRLLIKAVEHIRKTEQRLGYEKLLHYVDPAVKASAEDAIMGALLRKK
jgi:hypothetical protein